MNKIKFAAGAAIVALAAAFTACSSDDDINSNGYTDKDVVVVTADVSEMTTRGSYTTANLDRFGMSISNIANSGYSYDNVNVKFSTSANAWDSERTMLWQNESAPVDIVAYAPYNGDYTDNIAQAKDFPVTLPTTQTENENDADFLLFKAANFIPKDDLTDGKVHVTLKHALSQINVKVNFGDELEQSGKFTENPVTKFVVGGTATTGIVDFTAAEPTVVMQSADGRVTDVEGYYVSNSFVPGSKDENGAEVKPSASFSCIVIPQTSDNFRLSFVIGGRTFTWRAPSNVTFEAGKRYSLELNAGKDLVLMGEFNITPWSDAGEQDLKTD